MLEIPNLKVMVPPPSIWAFSKDKGNAYVVGRVETSFLTPNHLVRFFMH
jgi:hypothetical protein